MSYSRDGGGYDNRNQGVSVLMPCPFTGPKMFWAGPKIYLHIGGCHKHFVPDKKMIRIQ